MTLSHHLPPEATRSITPNEAAQRIAVQLRPPRVPPSINPAADARQPRDRRPCDAVRQSKQGGRQLQPLVGRRPIKGDRCGQQLPAGSSPLEILAISRKREPAHPSVSIATPTRGGPFGGGRW